MFTGIIEEVGRIRQAGSGHLRIDCTQVLRDVHEGDSVAVNGICLTVTSFGRAFFTADVMPETVRRTSLAELKPGDPVNLERALAVSARLGGHIVSGHIDGTGKIRSLREEGNAVLMTIEAAPEILHYVVEKGSVALDGISLTVAAVTEQDFMVSLIPHTREITNLGSKHAGSLINIETDILGKYVEKLIAGNPAETRGRSGGLSRAMLSEYGF